MRVSDPSEVTFESPEEKGIELLTSSLSLSLCLSSIYIKNVYVLLVKIVTVHVHLGFWQVPEINCKNFKFIFLFGCKGRDSKGCEDEKGTRCKNYDNSN